MSFYRIFYWDGIKKVLILEAQNEKEAIKKFRYDNDRIILKIEKVKKKFSFNLSSKPFYKVDYPILISSFRRVGVLLKAGLSLKEAFEEVDVKNRLVRDMFKECLYSLERGRNISAVFEKYAYVLGYLAPVVIKVGEKTGDLAFSFETLVGIYENFFKNKKEVLNSIRYPLIVFVSVIISFIVLIVMVLPKFEKVFEKLDANLPFFTVLLLNIKNIVLNYGVLILFFITAVYFLFIFLYKKHKSFKLKADKFVLKIPFIGKTILFSQYYKFAFIISVLMNAGISLMESLVLAKNSLNNEFLVLKAEKVIEDIKRGKSFYGSLKRTSFFDSASLKIISAGENSGELNEMISHVSFYYKDKLDFMIKNLNAYIEPFMLLMVGFIVLMLALGVFMPMWDLASAARSM
ncbi:MAG: type II secretion system F family protein [Nautiliaceae bacterium]